ncbi:glycoside hydrolase family 140 protein [Bacteroidales bacterium]|nr:glycoside hydrolase family 140 protein [Bacteroidales bacterium]
MKNFLLATALLLIVFNSSAKQLPLLKVSNDSNYLVTANNEPFFWLGGTAWELIHRLNREEVDMYLEDRANKGFTVIQTVILAELDGLKTPNAYGQIPLNDNDPNQLNEKYFEHVDYVIKKAGKLGMYIGLLPTWGDKFNKKWGTGPEIFTSNNAETYGQLLAQRYLKQKNIIWILGGDRAIENNEHDAIIRSMVKGIRSIDQNHLMTFHPVGGKIASNFFDEDWLDFDMFQSGHNSKTFEFKYVQDSKKAHIKRPVINGEARYENIPDRFWDNKDYGWLDDYDVRVSAYWTMLGGAAGYTYGCNDIWQMYDMTKNPIIGARTGWEAALHLPGSSHMTYMKDLFTILPWQTMHLAQSVVLNDNPVNDSYILCNMDANKEIIIAYTPKGKAIKLNLPKLASENIKAYWYNPRSGKSKFIGDFKTSRTHEFRPWSQGRGSDFILIVVDAGHSINDKLMSK